MKKDINAKNDDLNGDNGREEEVKDPSSVEAAEKDPAGRSNTGAGVTLSQDEYQRLKDEAAGFKDKWVRTMAEFENARKRNERERLEFIKYANEGLIGEFLSILDDLERTVQAAASKHQDYESFLKGVELVMAKIFEMLKRNNVRPVESVGKPFDPHSQEVLMQEETADYPEGTVIEEFQKGYYLNDRVVRSAKVKVAAVLRDGHKKQDQE